MNKGPKPLIEEHFHIRVLIDAQEKRTEDRNYCREKAKESEERNETIKDSKLVTITDFWCEDCQKDFKSMSIKQIEVDWTNSKQNIAFYKTKCDCGKWCIRLITDKFKDSFWTKSKAVARDRGSHYKDTLQPWQSGFHTLYKKI